MSRELHALETKSGRGLLRGGGRARPERTSILATAARGYFGMRAAHLSKVSARREQRASNIRGTVGKLERMRSYPKRANRIFATQALVGSGGAYAKLRQADRRASSASRALGRVQRYRQHFGG